MKLKYTFETVDMGNETVAVPVGKDANKLKGVVKLNGPALEIFNLLKQDTTEEAIIECLCNKYEDQADQIATYVKKAVAEFREAGIL